MALKDVIGQESAVKILESAILNHKVASAYLFQGYSGIGKYFTALNFAKALNCTRRPARKGFRAGEENGAGADACDDCPSCGRIEAGIHPDVAIIRPEKGVIKIEEIRKLEETLSLCSYEGGYKAAIVDDAHLMNDKAANAFLKCLEEPPAGSVIVLVSSNPDRLPVTIRSRCLALAFKPLSASLMESLLKDRIKDPEKRHALIGLSMGRPGLVIEKGGKGGDILKKRQEFVKSLLQMLAGSRGNPSWSDKEEIEEFMDGLELCLRDMLVLRTTGKEELLLNPALPEKVKSLGKAASEEVIIDCYRGIAGIKNSLVYNPNKSILWNYTAGLLGRLANPGDPYGEGKSRN